MNNEEVIQKLQKMVEELEQRQNELRALRNQPNVPIHERPGRDMQIHARISSLEVRLLHLRSEINRRELAKSLNESVPPISDDRKNAMNVALVKVSQDISLTNTFKAKIELASQISNAATVAADASSPS